MRKVQCCECGKHYDYDEDGFCPKCGAFNQPPRAVRISAEGDVVRVDGLNEAGHSGSFVHQELHEETRERRRSGLDRGVQRIPRPQADAVSKRKTATAGGKPTGLIGWIIFSIIALNVLANLFAARF